MRRPKRRLWPWLLVLALGSCISLEEMHIPKGAVRKDQRTLVAVFAGPGPVMTTEENKAEKLGDMTPGLALVVAGAQDERDLAASKDLAQYLPPFDLGREFYAELMKALPKSGHPGVFLSPDDAGVSDEQMTKFNKASDILDWRLRYYIQNPDNPLPRNYEVLLQLNDALVFEADAVYGLSQDDQTNATPNLSCVIKLFRVDGMHLLWRHEVSVEDKPGMKMVYEFKTAPDDLLAKYRKLIPALAAKVVEDYRKELSTAGLTATPKASVVSSTAAPTGWFAAPALSTTTARGRRAPVSVSTAAATSPSAPAGWFPVPSLPGMTTSTTTIAAPAAAPPISTTTALSPAASARPADAPAIEVPPLLMAPPPDVPAASTGTTTSP